jgi:hypothetical protein
MDRLSELPDDLIRRVFHFASVKEAASTGAFSRRFRSVWRSSDAVNLEARALEDDGRYRCSYNSEQQTRRFLSHRDAFVSGAKAALHAADDHVTRFSIRLQARADDTIRNFVHLRSDGGWTNNIDVVADVLSHPKLRRVEELQIAMDYDHGSFDAEASSHRTGVYVIKLGSIPSKTLRVLELISCKIFTLPAAVKFPCLASLRMDNCYVSLEHLQSVIFSAPALHALHLESVFLGRCDGKEEGTVVRLQCPAVTWLVLDKCGWTEGGCELEIDAPRLRRFKYTGLLRRLSLSPQPPPDLSRVDLHFISGYGPPCRDRVLLWKFLHNFRSAKELKLLVQVLEYIAVVDAAERAKLLRPFRNLERLELGGVHRPKGKTAAVAIANLLRCCPAVRDLHINLSTTKNDSDKQPRHVREFLQRKSRDDLHNSIQHFLRRRLERVVSLKGEISHDDADDYDEAADIPALTGRSFPCLQDSLRRVSLRFWPENTNCFGMKLIRFFAENGVALEEMRIDDGNNWMNDHANRKVERWIANSSSHKRNTTLKVLPLKR